MGFREGLHLKRFYQEEVIFIVKRKRNGIGKKLLSLQEKACKTHAKNKVEKKGLVSLRQEATL